MLDFKKLDQEITDLLNNTSKENLLSWLENKIEKENSERIINGEIAIFITSNCIANISVTKNKLLFTTINSAGDNNYALAG